MESPSSNSGPFKATSSATNICSIGNVSDHDFVVTGLAAGSCVVTVTDASKKAASVAISVQTPPPSSSMRPLGGRFMH